MDLVEFFADDNFDANEYVRRFFENNDAAAASDRCEELEELRRQTEETLRQGVVRNYKIFMQATAQIQSMERDIDALRGLLSTANTTLSSFQSIRLVERSEGGRAAAIITQFSSRTGPGLPGGAEVTSPLNKLKLPEWLEKASTELEELLLERKHEEAVRLICQVLAFAANVRSATNLSRSVVAIFKRAESMAEELSKKLLIEITSASTFAAWGFAEHMGNFRLLIELGYADMAAKAFIAEKGVVMKRALRAAQAASDPLAYVRGVSDTFFGNAREIVALFMTLFCGTTAGAGANRRGTQTQKSAMPVPANASQAYLELHKGAIECGAAPFCRLAVWLESQTAYYGTLVGRAINGLSLGAGSIMTIQNTQAANVKQPSFNTSTGASSILNSSAAAAAAKHKRGKTGPAPVGPADPESATLFCTASLMLEEALASATRLHCYGFPVGAALAAQLCGDAALLLEAYAQRAEGALAAAVSADPLDGTSPIVLASPEPLHQPIEDQQTLQLTVSSAALIRIVKDIVEYGLLLMEPPPRTSADPDWWWSGESEERVGSYYTRENFLELQPHILKLICDITRSHAKATSADLQHRVQQGTITLKQAEAARDGLANLSRHLAPAVELWCTELLPELAGDGDLDSIENIRAALEDAAISAAEIVESLEQDGSTPASAGNDTSKVVTSEKSSSVSESVSVPIAKKAVPASTTLPATKPTTATTSTSTSSANVSAAGSPPRIPKPTSQASASQSQSTQSGTSQPAKLPLAVSTPPKPAQQVPVQVPTEIPIVPTPAIIPVVPVDVSTVRPTAKSPPPPAHSTLLAGNVNMDASVVRPTARSPPPPAPPTQPDTSVDMEDSSDELDDMAEC